MSSCCGAPAPKEKKWGVKDCRARKCPDLKKNELYPDESQERCYALGDDHNSMMPGTLSCCIKDLDNMPPEQFLRHVIWSLQESWEKKFSGNRKTPGPKNCPPTCPYKASEEGKVRDRSNKADFYAMKKGLIWSCIFTGEVLGSGMSTSCPCHILDNPDQEKQIENLKFSFSGRTHIPFNRRECHTVGCPDGICRCKQGDIICPVIKIPFIEIKECPLWRIPAKTLPAIAVPAIPAKSDPEVPEKPESSQGKVTQKEKTPSRNSSPKEKKKEKVRSIEGRIDDLEHDCEIYLWADFVHCCVLVQEIKCLFRGIGISAEPTAKTARKATPRIEHNQSDLFSFDRDSPCLAPSDPISCDDCPCDPAKEARSVKLLAACLDCDATNTCESHDPHAGCERDLKEETPATLKDPICYCTPCKTWATCTAKPESDECKAHRTLYENAPGEEKKGGCTNCGHHKTKKTFAETCTRLKDLMFKGGEYSATRLMAEVEADGCLGWIEKPEKTEEPEKEYTTHYYTGKDLSPSLGTCPDKCAYKDAGKSTCRFTDQQFLRMESCPTGVLQADAAGQKCQLENIARALARLSANLPSKERCQCNPCPDGVQSCGVSDENCPFSKNPFDDLALCPMTNPRRVRQIRREYPVKFVSIEETRKKIPQDQPTSEKPNCGGKRPAISRCPDNCPDKSIEKEGGYPQGRCKQTGEKLREMQTCPNDPPKETKKSPAGGPKPYTIHIKRSEGNHPLIVSCDSRNFGGTSNPCDTREEVIKRALVTLDGFVHDARRSTLQKKPLPVTLKTTLFIDKTGMFTTADFFDEAEEPKKPVVEPKKSTSKNPKKEETQ